MILRKISLREKTRDVWFEVPRGHQDGVGMARGDHPGRRKQKEHEGEKKGGKGRVRGGLKVTGETMFTGKGKRPGTPYVRGQRADALCRSQLAGTYFLQFSGWSSRDCPYQSLLRRIPVSLCLRLDRLQFVSKTY